MGADVVVIGAGPSGLAVAAAMLAEAGRQVQVIARGHGFTHWAAGGIDVLGRLPAGDEAGAGEPVERPLEALGRLPDGHPYSLVGEGALLAGIGHLRALTDRAGIELVGDPAVNRSQITGIGTRRTTALLQTQGDGALAGRVAAIGFAGFEDFSSHLCADRLHRVGWTPCRSRSRCPRDFADAMSTRSSWPAPLTGGSSAGRWPARSAAPPLAPTCAWSRP